jgi:hypothetical protein
LRAVLVFFASSYFFCSEYESQCISLAKIIATVMVVSGLLIFIISKEKTEKVAPECDSIIIEEGIAIPNKLQKSLA